MRWFGWNKYSVARTPHGKHLLLVLRLQGDVPIPHPCGASLSPRPWGSPPSAASPSQGVSAKLRRRLQHILFTQTGVFTVASKAILSANQVLRDVRNLARNQSFTSLAIIQVKRIIMATRARSPGSIILRNGSTKKKCPK